MTWAGIHRRADSALRLVENGFAILAGISLCIMAILVTVDVFMRYLFADPLAFQLHLISYYLLVAMFMLALPWGYRNGGAIQIRQLLDALPTGLARWMVRIGLIASFAYMTALAIQGFEGFWSAYVKSEVVMGVIDWPVAWSWVWIPIGCGFLALRVLLDGLAPVPPAIGLEE